jgi:ABC-type transporter Mla MlaB component
VHLVLPVLRKVVQVVRLRAAVPLALELVQDVDEGLREVRDVDIGLAALARVDVAGVAVLQGEADEVGNLVGVALGGLWQR